MKKVLITGIDSFTGKHLSSYLEGFGYDVYGTSLIKQEKKKKYTCNICTKNDVVHVLEAVKPDYLIHLAGISFVGHGDSEAFYKVNTMGTLNILDVLVQLNITLKKVILVSSATVYGNQGLEVLDESLCPKPANHYGASKFAMESLVNAYFDKLPIILTRPFNYTGIGQAENFLIPKIVKHFKEKKETMELGNIDVYREFNDVNFICEGYRRLLESDVKSEVVNICSNRGIKLLDVVKIMEKIAKHKIKIKINPAFVRKNEIKKLIGSSVKLNELVGTIIQKEFSQTLKEMYESKV